jgi:hypothetical protein
VAHAEHGFGDIHLVGVKMPGQSFEIAQHLEPCYAQAALADGGDRGCLAPRMLDQVARREHDLGESALVHRAQLGLERPGERDGVHAEVILVHG